MTVRKWGLKIMNDTYELDEKKINMMKIRIISLERENLKTQEKTHEQMADKIRGIIAEEIRKTY